MCWMNWLASGLQFISAIFALVAAYYWNRSTSIEISPNEIKIATGICDGYVHVDATPINKLANSLKEQAIVSKLAARYAFLCAFFQAISLLLQLFV